MSKMIQTEDKVPLLGSTSSNVALKPPKGWGYRHSLAFLAFFGFVNVYCMRVNLSVAMVDMVKPQHKDDQNSTSDECQDHNLNSTKTNEGEFDWSTDLQDYILGSFFYGYILTQIPGGWMAEKFGAKWLFGLGVLCTSVLTLVTPIAARYHVGVFIAVRVLEGLGEGVTFPAMHAMWGKWAPLYERSKLAGFSYAGAQLGTVFALPISGWLCDQKTFAGGWPSVFYVFGGIACVWFLVWTLFAYNTPADHPKISREEREFIESSVGMKEDIATPWGAILRCPAVWAVCIAHFSNNWGFYTMLTTLPSYMKNILKFDIKTNGMLSALPYLGCWIGQNSSGITADYLRSKGYLSTVATRRLFTVFGLAVPGLTMILIQFAGCNQTAAVAMLVLCLTAGGFTMGGFQVNHIDLSPNFAGVLMGMSNTWATIPGFLGPAVVGWLTHKHDTRDQWQIVFYIAAAVYLSGAVLYFLLSRGTVQDWNEPVRGVSFKHRETKSPTYRIPAVEHQAVD
ncbi:sialin-like [Ruditapes philippinarum]|uniref:sialin-like n=1 Tax=Ruditapes philippinarum TaxID=129788 RepID=UPI00295BE0DC|nr:sialin-like [Ruditapes philippinarum]